MASNALVDTPVKLARCNRCQAYVWLAMSSGIRSAADTGPATHAGWIAAIADGRRTFRLTTKAGRPDKLLTRRLGDSPPVFRPDGTQEGLRGAQGGVQGLTVVVEHGCGGHARNMLTFEEVQQGPLSAHATPGSSRVGGPHPEAAHGLRVEEIPRSHARPVTRRPSEEFGAVRCGICDRIIDQANETFWGIHHARWLWAEHEECP